MGNHHKITLINEQDHFQFTPSSPWIAMGKQGHKAMTFELRPYLEKKQVVFNEATALDYDYFVIVTGPSLVFNEVEGSDPNGYVQSICTKAHTAQDYDVYTSLPQGEKRKYKFDLRKVFFEKIGIEKLG